MMYKRLGIGELKPTKIVLQLANHSTKFPRGMLEDVLINVGKFIFPVDFTVLEAEMVVSPKNEIPLTLERPFLTT